MIKIENLSKKYGSNQVLTTINLSFKKGKVYGIVGNNGAGKTTLFNCIANLEKYEGKVTCNLNNLKDNLGFLQTESYFFAKITGREYIQLLCNARNVEVEVIDEQNIFDLPLDKYAINYSTGMKKKLALTAILLQENKYYIFDEPFNGVDIQSNIIITEIIKTLKELDKIVIISSHVFSTLSNSCDVIYQLEKGKIIKTVEKNEFNNLENEMKAMIIGSKIKNLNLK